MEELSSDDDDFVQQKPAASLGGSKPKSKKQVAAVYHPFSSVLIASQDPIVLSSDEDAEPSPTATKEETEQVADDAESRRQRGKLDGQKAQLLSELTQVDVSLSQLRRQVMDGRTRGTSDCCCCR